MNIKDQLKKLPEKPGVYLMKDKDNHIIYVGKSKTLRIGSHLILEVLTPIPPKSRPWLSISQSLSTLSPIQKWKR